MSRIYYLAISLSSLLMICCGISSTSSSAQPSPVQTLSVQASPSPTPEFPEPVRFEGIEGVFVGGGGLEGARMSFNGYELTTRERRVRIRDGGEEFDVEQSNVILTRNGRVVRRFEGMMHGFGVATRFGLYSFLGGEAKQIVIEQTSHRNEYYRILDITDHEPRVIYEGSYYISATDFDRDGAMEIIAPVKTFWFFYHFDNTNSPFTTAVFRYDARAGRYAIANREFASYVMRDVERTMRVVEEKRPTSEEVREPALRGGGLAPDHHHPEYLSAVVSMLIDHIYAGRETEGWAFYDREYNLSDKETLRARIREELARDEIYNELYGH